MFKGIVLALAIFASGCASLTAPRGVSDSAAYALGQSTALRSTCTEFAAKDRITKEQAELCLQYTDNARKMVEAAREAKDPQEKLYWLEQALGILTALEVFLEGKQ